MAELERLDVELEPDGGTFHGRPSDGSRSIRNRKELELLLTLFWAPATVFVVAEVVSYLCMHKSFFVALTGNAFDVGISYEQVVEVHVFASIAMWILAAVQIRIETRKRQSPALHRLTGVVMLLLFFLIVFPSSLYLSALQRIEYWAPAVAAVLLDTAGCTAFFLYRGWRVARLRATSESLALHGRLMQCGVMMSMAILPQRFLQFYLSMQFRTFPQVEFGPSALERNTSRRPLAPASRPCGKDTCGSFDGWPMCPSTTC
ncbi:unnamed protein product [Cladocopium goreaui]|uniref:Uncharacterized protein n=1 Tax=Cladocopium goreaui TaxID=2562237 RepID=A0A9P1CA12_9DINO|nr:unnamed protein product [Cladocopium goreaui]